MKAEILKVLKENKGYLSGQQLCESLGVSRTAVWKAMGQLKEEGYQIEAVRNRGYRLVETADVMTTAELRTMLCTKWMGAGLEYFDETDSTNIQARRLAENGAPHGTLVVAGLPDSRQGPARQELGITSRHRHLDEHGVKAGFFPCPCFHADFGRRDGCGKGDPHGHRP